MKIFLLVLILILAVVVWQAIVFYGHVSASKKLARENHPYQQPNEKADYRVLFVGDSTGVGTGAADPKESVAGRLGADHPNIEIVNIAKNGDHARDLVEKLKKVSDRRFNLVVVNVGGNDILQFVNLGDFEKDLSGVLDQAKSQSDNVVLYTTGDVGQSNFFPPLVGKIFTKRSSDVRDIALRLTSEKGVMYVDLFADRDNAALDLNLHSPDLLHPNGEGYKYWFEKLKRTLASGGVEIPK